MRVSKISALALAAVAATLSLTACDSGSSNASAATSSAASGKTVARTDAATGTRVSTGAATCRTANLSLSTSGGMAEGEVLINMENTGSRACSMHGYPGVDLRSRYGTVSAARSTISAPHVTLAPGESTRATLHFPPNHTGGSGVTFTSLLITPPNETHSRTVNLDINVPADSNSGPRITVDPVGSGK